MSDEEMKSVAESCRHFYWKLFQSTFLISAFTVGGGFVIIPLLRAKYVDEYGWLDDKETLNLVSIAQSMPGVVAVNAAIILGYRMAGLRGALTALAATILPPLVTLSVISCAYDWFATNPYVRYALKGMQCGATALIVNVAIDLLQKQWRKKLLWPLAIIVGTFVANFFFDVNIMLLVVIDGLLGLVFLRGAAYGK
ncbi:chromate transporter [uncultured Selenomonas sp.]|uniref:chromate transporter n=1 Tax=uncultured Selenomonas sp. TaxID=159275 RepID=UPI00258B6DA0|nr:chromate transporter [uncultured Selenomonas sp.]